MYARDVFENAQASYTNGSKLISKSYEQLNSTKKLYLEALQCLDIYKKGIKGKHCVLPDGKTIEVTSSFTKTSGIQPTCIKVFDKNKKNIYDFHYFNGNVSKIVEFNPKNMLRISSFNGFSVDIVDEFDIKTKDIGAKYSFYKGKLKEIEHNITLVPFAYYTSNFYAYKNDKLIVNEQDTKKHFSGLYSVKHRYNFIDGYLANYYKNFSIDSKKAYSWEESCHYSKDAILGKTKNASQDSSFKNIVAENAIFLSGNRFLNGKNIICKIGDDRTVIFSE